MIFSSPFVAYWTSSQSGVELLPAGAAVVDAKCLTPALCSGFDNLVEFIRHRKHHSNAAIDEPVSSKLLTSPTRNIPGLDFHYKRQTLVQPRIGHSRKPETGAARKSLAGQKCLNTQFEIEPQVTGAFYPVYHWPLCCADIIDEQILSCCGYVVMNCHIDCQSALPRYKRTCGSFLTLFPLVFCI
ncbi:hypothetical protein CPB83DRAFT_841175 [Crepidotus variabilis]|uniref:Uncharacterized protein n=1 Tax=Crepidotus variabilis TaxID=179855 RepID=A0A9P6JHW5_9AGAR|nr:hypothetical protein CPB83DRAFT_841175 [Crepidotus variabilis]